VTTNESDNSQSAWTISYYNQILLKTTPVWVSELFTDEKKKKSKETPTY
jgi:hypothetical protein